MKNNLYGFAGRARSGKSCTAKYFEKEYGAKIVTIASFLKRLCVEMLNFDSIEDLNQWKDDGTELNFKFTEDSMGLISERTDIDYGNVESVCSGRTLSNVREALQFIGTDVIRKFKPTWHVDCMAEEINSYKDNQLIIVDDVRFPNERVAVENLGGKCMFFMRPKMLTNVTNHASETSIHWYDFPDRSIIINDATERELYCEVEKIIISKPLQHMTKASLYSHRTKSTRSSRFLGIDNNVETDRLIALNIGFDWFMKDGMVRVKGDNLEDNPFIVENLKMYL